MVSYTLAPLVLGGATYAKSGNLFWMISTAARFLEGFGSAFMLPAVYAIVSSRYPNNPEFMAWLSMVMGFAICSGPVMGEFVYYWVGYEWTQYFYSFFCLICGLIPSLIIPQKVESANTDEKVNGTVISISSADFTNLRSLIGCMASWSIAFITYYDATAALRL